MGRRPFVGTSSRRFEAGEVGHGARQRSARRRLAAARVTAVTFGLSVAATGAALAASVDDLGGLERAGARCAEPDHPGGDWPSLNHDGYNTRNQDRERSIGVEQAPSLSPAWHFSVAEAGAEGGLQSTPVVAGGCVYVATGSADLDVQALASLEPQPIDFRGGTVLALNAEDGALVWQTELNGSLVGLAAAGGLIYAFPFDAPAPSAPAGRPEPAGAHAVALDAASGKVVWVSKRLDDERSNGSWINASPVVFTPSPKSQGAVPADARSLLFVPLSGGWGDGSRVPLYFLDAGTGDVVKRFFALENKDSKAGYGGAGIWTTAAFDRTTNHLYAGTADSEGHTRQHSHNNAMVKIDADPHRRTFASVVDAYTGTSDQYDLDQVPGWQNTPACKDEDLRNLLTTDQSASTACLEQDIDFGASPNLYVDSGGRTLAAALQKSGVLHVIETAGMEPVWTRVLSVPHQISNAATAATGASNLYVRAFPDLTFSFERSAGALSWASSTGTSPFAYQPLTLANGVLYTITDAGQLVALDAGTGRVLLSRPISSDAGVESCYGWGAGVAVARNTVYAPCDGDRGLFLPGGPGALVAYRPSAR